MGTNYFKKEQCGKTKQFPPAGKVQRGTGFTGVVELGVICIAVEMVFLVNITNWKELNKEEVWFNDRILGHTCCDEEGFGSERSESDKTQKDTQLCEGEVSHTGFSK